MRSSSGAYYPALDHVRAVAAFMVAFPLMLPIGYLSYKLIEEPFLRLRRSYRRQAPAPATVARQAPVAQET